MKVVLVALLALAVCVFAQNTGDSDFISSFNRHGWDVIFANNTSFLSKIQYHNGVIFVSGEGNVREINENPFEISWHHRFFRQHYRYLDFQAFVHNNLTWVFGPVEAGAVDFMDDGANHPLQIANFTDSDTAVSQSTAGTQIAAVAATDMDDHVVVYGIGWDLRATGVNNDPRADLTVWRIFVHPMHTQYHNGSFISGNNVTEFYDDRVPLNSGNYTEFTRTYKPWIFHSSYHEHVIVVDPATKMVYQLFAPNHTNSEFKGKNNILSKLPSGFSSNNVTAAHYDHPSGILYVATKSDGIYPGSIVAIDTVVTPMKWLWEKTLDMYESNPKAIDIRGDVLYAGLNGGSVILKLDLKNNGKTLGYVTLPWYLREIASIHAGGAHIYIVTHEQYAKVARTLNENVCPTPCDFFYGFCNNGKCECDKSHTLNPKNNRCEPNYNVIDSYHSGEVAMGILFALCFIAGAAGWYIVYRVKQGKGLPPILGATGRYSLVNGGGEERHGFLGSDE